MNVVMRLGAILAACLLWIDAVYGSCSFEPCPKAFEDAIKRTAVPRGLQALIGRMQDQLIGRMSGSRLRRLQPSEFLGKRSPKRVSEFLGKRANKPLNPEFLGKRSNIKPSELLGKRDDAWNDWKRASEFLGKRSSPRSEEFSMARGERGARLRLSGREFLGKRFDETENLSSNEEIRDVENKK